MENLFNDLKPDAVVSFQCVTLGDFLGYLFAKALNIKVLNFLIHNYFPPSKEEIVLNVASPDKEKRTPIPFDSKENEVLSAVVGVFLCQSLVIVTSTTWH